ncbi:MAG: hypothetical protein RIB67_09875 [Miltoncostaeaceae bacterium]
MADRSAEVADGLWVRVRSLAARIEELEELHRLDELDEDGRARLDSLRVRCARAARRAGMADELADRLAGLRRGGAA